MSAVRDGELRDQITDGDPDVRRQIVIIGVYGGVQARSVQSLLETNRGLMARIESYLSSD